MKKPFMDEAVKMDAEKIVNEKMQNFWTAVICITILLMCTLIGWSVGESIGETEGRKEMIQELCEKQQYDFCEPTKIIYKMKDNNS